MIINTKDNDTRLSKVITFILMLAVSGNLSAQKNITTQNLFWYGLFTTIQLNEKWSIQNEFQQRHFIAPAAQHQFLIRTHVHRLLGKSGWDASVGMCVFFQSPNDPLSADKLIVPELRPHLELGYKQKLPRVTLDHRYRVEARFYHQTNVTRTVLEEGFEYGNFRFRYRFQATLPLFKIASDRYFKLKFSDEIHLNAGGKIIKNIFEQNRIFGGVNIDALENLSFEIGYLNWFQQRPNGDFYNRNIVRFSVYHKIAVRKKAGGEHNKK